MTRLEGNGRSRLIGLMKIHGYNKDVGVELGTIVSVPPAIKVRMDNDSFTLDKDDLIVGYSIANSLRVGDKVIVLAANNEQKYYVIDRAVTY